MSETTNPTPDDHGNKDNVPFEAQRMARLPGRIIAWTSFDRELEPRLRSIVFQQAPGPLGPLCILPCLCPLQLFVIPYHLWTMPKIGRVLKAQYWILTERELCIVNLETKGCEHIPLEDISSIRVDEWAFPGFTPVPNIYVETPTSIAVDNGRQAAHSNDTTYVQKSYAAHGVGLSNYESFTQQVIERSDVVKKKVKQAIEQALKSPL